MKVLPFLVCVFTSLSALETIPSPVEGFVESIFVSKGDHVEEGQPLLELIQPTESFGMATAEAELKDLLIELATLKQEIVEGEEQHSKEQAHKKENIQKKLDVLQGLLTSYEVDLSRNEKLLKEGLITEDVLEESAELVEVTKTKIVETQVSLEEVSTFRSEDLQKLQKEIQEKQSAIKEYKQKQNMQKVASPISGMVKEVFVGVGDQVYEGTPLLTIM